MAEPPSPHPPLPAYPNRFPYNNKFIVKDAGDGCPDIDLDHFENKTGKYAIDGYPHKLGLLLYGPPGTGKTSLIKALAQKTARHVVNIPLARIKTNQELMDIVFDQLFKVVAFLGTPTAARCVCGAGHATRSGGRRVIGVRRAMRGAPS